MLKIFILGTICGAALLMSILCAFLYLTERPSCLILPANKGKNGGGDSGAGIICTRFLGIMPGKAGKPYEEWAAEKGGGG